VVKTVFRITLWAPFDDTFARVFAALDPSEFQQCFLNWVKSFSTLTQGEIVAIALARPQGFDGKTLRHSYDKGTDKAAIHMVSAWAINNSLVLGQIKVNQKSFLDYRYPRVAKGSSAFRVYCHH